MITLYDYLPSQNAYKVRLLLSYLNQPYNTKFISIFEGEGQTEEFLKINPTGTVPAIETEDGKYIAESNAILMYLAEGTAYLPEDRYLKAKVVQWLCYETEVIQAGIATLRHWTLTEKTKNRSEEMLQIKKDLCLKSLATMERHLSGNDFFCGNQYTIADIAIFAYTHLAEEAGLTLKNYPALTTWIKRVKDQPGYLPDVHPYSIDPYSYREL